MGKNFRETKKLFPFNTILQLKLCGISNPASTTVSRPSSLPLPSCHQRTYRQAYQDHLHGGQTDTEAFIQQILFDRYYFTNITKVGKHLKQTFLTHMTTWKGRTVN